MIGLTTPSGRKGIVQAFDGFDNDKVCDYDEDKPEALRQGENIIRIRLKYHTDVLTFP